MRALTNWRWWLLAIIAAGALFNLIGVPAARSDNYWALQLYSKFTAIMLAIIDFALYQNFKDNGKIDDISKTEE